MILFILHLFMCPLWAYVENKNLDQFANLNQMNGHKFEDYKNFEKKWKLITVRYRTDTGELRFTYANDIAYRALMKGSTDYPEGSVFGKAAFLTEEDAAFTSSKVPSGVRRFQLMVRDKKKHASTQGWGYALFDGEGKTFPEDPSLKVQACAACHNLVPDRGYVFSQPMVSSDAIKAIRNKYTETKGLRFVFKSEKVQRLPDTLSTHLKNFKDLLVLDGELRKYIFQGTLDEIIPSLLEESRKQAKPVILANESFDRFSLVIPQYKICGEKNGFYVIQTQLEKDSENKFKTKLKVICEN